MADVVSGFFRPSQHAEALRDIAHGLSHIRLLSIRGADLCRCLLNRPFLEERTHWPRLRDLQLQLGLNDSYEPTLFADIGLLPNLQRVRLDGPAITAPADALNLDRALYLAPRSSTIRHLVMVNHGRILADVRPVLQSFACLVSLTIESWHFYSSFINDLRLLPPTVELLALWLGGHICRPANTAASLSDYRKQQDAQRIISRLGEQSPKFADVLLNLPKLSSLSLDGDVVGPASFDLIDSLSSLRTVVFGPHAKSDPALLVNYICNRWSHLVILGIDICECQSPSVVLASSSRTAKSSSTGGATGVPGPRWRAGFGRVEARAIVVACHATGLDITGTILCATDTGAGMVGERCNGRCRQPGR